MKTFRVLPIVLILFVSSCVYAETKQHGLTTLTGLAALDNNPHLTVVSLTVTPVTESVPVGNDIGYTATLTLSNSKTYDVTNISSWTSSSTAIARVTSLSTTENYTCMSTGTITVRAVFGAFGANASLECTGTPPAPTVGSITISPVTPSTAVGQTQQYTAVGLYSDGTSADITSQVTWTSGTTSVATMSSNVATCVTGGTSVITATLGLVLQTTTQTCTAVLTSISVTPATANVLVGATPTFSATGTYNDGSSSDVTSQAVWTSSNTTVATIGVKASPQSVNALTAGTSTIRATIGSVSNTAALTVTSSGPPPPTISTIGVAPANRTVNVGNTLALTATGTYSDSSTANVSFAPTVWTTSNAAVAALQLPDCVSGTACNSTLVGTGSTPYTWSVPAVAAPGGAVDILDWMSMPLPDRNSFHMSGSALKYFRQDGGLLWWLKGSAGNPWDGELYDAQWVYHWFTEDGDSADQAACIAAGYSSCFVDPFANKTFVTPVPFAPRYFVPGSTITVLTPTTLSSSSTLNPYKRTTNCGVDNQPLLYLGNIKSVTSGPTTINWGGSVGSVSTIEIDYYYSGNASGVYQNRERYWLAQGFGQIQWDVSSWNGSGYNAPSQVSLNNTKSAGGAPTPNFGCKVPTLPIVGGLPPGTLSTASPVLNLRDSTGAISGAPTTPGTYAFTVQQEDAGGAFHLQDQTIQVSATSAGVQQTVKCLTAGGPVTITATNGAIVGTTTITCQAPVPTIASIAVTPSPTSVILNSSIGLTATGTYSDSSTQNLTSTATWVSSAPAVAVIGAASNPQIVICKTVGTTNITAQSGAVTSPAAVVNCVNPPTGNGGNIYCTGTTNATCFTGNQTDAGASLPTSGMYTGLNGTPSPGVTHGPYTTLSALQAAVTAGACGDIYIVTAGADLGTGILTLPQKNCDNAHWNWIHTSGTTDPNFPAEGVRLTPCSGGFASLPGRPSYPCPSPTNLLFRIAAANSTSAIVSNKGDHWRITGALITRVPTGGVAISNLVSLNATGNPQTNNIIFDRDWFAGIEGTFPVASISVDTSTTRAVFLGQANHIAVIDSYFTNFYDTSVRSSNGQTDAQCMAGGFGSLANSGWGVYKFVNNHCEASGEGLLFGGAGGPALTPSGCTIMVNCNVDTPADLEIRQNYFFKPLQWNGNTTVPGSTGWPVVKNGFEMKTGVRVLFEGNVIENCWYNAQGCSTFNIAPINQQSGGSPPVATCPTCVTNDFVFRYNYSYNVAAGIAVYAMMGAGCSTCQSQGMNRVSIHDNLIADNQNLGNLTARSAGDAIEILATDDTTGKGLNRIQNVTINHNTFVKATRSLIVFGGPTNNSRIVNLTMQNNLWPYGSFGWVAVGNSSSDCEVTSNPSFSFNTALNNCTTSRTWSFNGLFSWAGGALGAGWPTNGSGLGNFFYTGTSGPGFTNYGTGNSNFNPLNYQLTLSSPLHNAGSDGKDLGADIVTLNQKISGVRQ